MKNKIPPPIVMILFGLIIYIEDKYFPIGISVQFDGQRITTICLTIVALCIVALGILEFQKVKTTVNPLDLSKSSALVSTGIYRFTRNPMYLGMAVLLIAWCVKLGDLLGLLIVPLFMWYMGKFQIKPEEQAMSKLFGDEFEAYKKKVRRWL